MKIERYESNGRMSKAVVHGDTIYLCGHTCQEAGNDVQAQARGVLEDIEKRLEQYGSGKDHILSATVYLKDIDADFAGFNQIWDAWVTKGSEPARTCVQTPMARPELLVEVTVTAAKR